MSAFFLFSYSKSIVFTNLTVKHSLIAFYYLSTDYPTIFSRNSYAEYRKYKREIISSLRHKHPNRILFSKILKDMGFLFTFRSKFRMPHIAASCGMWDENEKKKEKSKKKY